MQKQNGKGAAVSYAWIILAVLYVGGIASYGMRATFGAYISPWELDFSVGRSVVTAISMLSFVVVGLAQPLLGKLNDYYGKSLVPSASILLFGICLLLMARATHIWQIFLLYGVGFSIGVTGSSNIISMAIIANWFEGKRGFALGLATSGMAVGQLILTPLNLSMIKWLGWRGTMTAMALIIMAVVGPLYFFLLRSRPEEKGMKPYGHIETEADGTLDGGGSEDKKSSLPVLGALKQRAFWLLAVPYFMCGFTDVGLIQTHIIPMSDGKGFSSVVAIAISIIAAMNIAGAIATGHLSDHFNRKRQLGVIYLTRAATFVFLMMIQRPWLLLVFAVVYGAMEMASIAPTNSLTIQLFDRYSIGAVLGLVSISHQLGGAVGSWVPGVLYDLTGSYTAVLLLSIALLVGSALLALRIPEPERGAGGEERGERREERGERRVRGRGSGEC